MQESDDASAPTPRIARVSVVVKGEEPSLSDAASVLAALTRKNVEHRRCASPKEADGDLIILVGDTAFVLGAVKDLPKGVPVLGVGSTGFGVFTEVTAERFPEALRRILSGDFWVESLDRVDCLVGGDLRATALNEAALVASTSAQLVRYSLWVGEELLWRDRGDGAIIATPTGSTAYALNAGGPILLAETQVFAVVPICSSEGNTPVVMSQRVPATVTDLYAAGGVDLVVDGRDRFRIGRGEEVRFVRSDDPARFIRFGTRRYAQILGKLKMERELAPDLGEAPPSAKFVYKLLEFERTLTQQEIIRESGLSARTVRNAVSYLLKESLIEREPNLRDARQDVYRTARR